MSHPKVSVVIPAYNAIAHLPETLDSVQQQSFQNFELLIVDDGSTDGTSEWVASLSDSRIRLITQTNSGCAAARNRGIQAAEGDYIAFLDADDIWEPGKLEKQVRILDNQPFVGLVYTWISHIDGQGQPIEQLGMPTVEGYVWELIVEENPIMCGSVPMVRRACFETVGLLDQQLRSAEDWDMWIRIARLYEFAVIKEPLVRYRIHAGSKSHNLDLHLRSRLRVIEKAFREGTEETADEADTGGGTAKESVTVKDRAYGLAYLSVAYRALQNDEIDRACELRKHSAQYYPALVKSSVFRRLGIILFLRRYLGNRVYERLLKPLKEMSRVLPLAIN